MSKKKSSTNLGKSLIRSRFGKHNKTDGDSYLHTSELNDGYEWGRLNLQSVTEQNNLEEFLATAELAGTEFTAEKLNVKFISKEGSGLPEAEELAQIAGLHKQHENLLCIPRRPPWTAETSPSELDQNERQSFLEWRRTLAALQDVEGLVMTPYEKNLDFWRQLWRVIERSDIVTQIVDARNPLLFYCGDLEKYVGEKDKGKMCLVLINKADYLDHYQRDAWASYFTERGIRVAFWSAVLETERQEAEKDEDTDQDDTKPEPTEDSSSDDPESDEETKDVEMPDENADDGYSAGREESPNAGQNDDGMDSEGDGSSKGNTVCEHCDSMVEGTDNVASEKTVECESCGGSGGKDARQGEAATDNMPGGKVRNTAHIYTGPELVEFLRSIHTGAKVNEGRTTVGMVGYPNVGKSSTINAILKMKKVPVSTTPGRTKHFQTLFVDQSLMLCDCPGLVFPSFVTTKADLVVNGILPIDQMRDCIPPSSLICSRIPRPLLEKTYGIMLPKPAEGEDLSRPPTAFELLNAYGSMRGYMTARGQPDAPRSSRYILKDYVNGKLLYCHPPPDKDANVFNKFETSETMSTDGHEVAEPGTRPATETTVAGRVDTDFFKKGFSAVHNRTARTGENDTSKAAGGQKDKSWKKHNNRNKKEKMRRVYSHLDGQ